MVSSFLEAFVLEASGSRYGIEQCLFRVVRVGRCRFVLEVSVQRYGIGKCFVPAMGVRRGCYEALR